MMASSDDNQVAAVDEIFVSYASVDRDIVMPVVGMLQKIGWSVFWDTHIEPGETWRKVISSKLATARCVVVIWSPTSIDRQWVIQEAEDGERRGCLVPVTVRGATPPLGLRHIQAIDLASWSGEPHDPTLRRLFSAVARHTRVPDELAKWQSIENTHNPNAIEAFIQLFPTGLFHSVAKSRLAEVRAAVAGAKPTSPAPDASPILRSELRSGMVEAPREGGAQLSSEELEAHTWQRVKLSRNITDIERFALGHPKGRFAEAARALADELWMAVAASGNVTRLHEFVEYHPDVSYAKQAKFLLLWHRMRSSSRLEDVEAFLSAAYAIGGTPLDLSSLNPFADQGVRHTKTAEFKNIDDVSAPMVMGWINGAVRTAIFDKGSDEKIDISSGKTEEITAYLQQHPNGFLRSKILAVNDWLSAVAVGSEQAIEGFFVRYPLDVKTEEALYRALRDKRAKDEARKKKEHKAKEEQKREAAAREERQVTVRRGRIFRGWAVILLIVGAVACWMLLSHAWSALQPQSIWEHVVKAAAIAAIPSAVFAVFLICLNIVARVLGHARTSIGRTRFVSFNFASYFLIFGSVCEWFMYKSPWSVSTSLTMTVLTISAMVLLAIFTLVITIILIASAIE